MSDNPFFGVREKGVVAGEKKAITQLGEVVRWFFSYQEQQLIGAESGGESALKLQLSSMIE